MMPRPVPKLRASTTPTTTLWPWPPASRTRSATTATTRWLAAPRLSRMNPVSRRSILPVRPPRRPNSREATQRIDSTYGRRSERGQVAEAQRLLDLADLLDRHVEAVAAELGLLDVLELVPHLLDLMRADRFLPGRKQDRVLPRRMMLIHQLEALQRVRHRLIVKGRAVGRIQHIADDLPAPLVLGQQHIYQRRRGPARLF